MVKGEGTLTLNGWMVLKAMGNVGTFNIKDVQIEIIDSGVTEYIKTEG